MGRKSPYTVRCPRCGRFGTLRLDTNRYLKVRHYGSKDRNGWKRRKMFSHYIGVIESRRVARLLEDLPDDYTRTFERILDEIREAAAPKLKRQADDKLHEIRNRTDLLEGVHEIIEYAKRINTRTERVMCPHCQKVVLIGNRRDGSLFIRNSENG